MEHIKVEQLSYQIHTLEHEILKSITQEFNQGEFYGILGPNGSGKTTFIRHILALLKVQKGTITLADKNMKDYKKRDLATRISFVAQNTYLDAEFTVYDIVAMGRTPYLKRFMELSSEEKEIIQDAMKITNTLAFSNKKFNQLSGGEAQRVLVARAIAQDTPWMILDEPISHLDIKHQVELMETLKQINREKKKTIITILHDLNLTSAYCSKVVLMKQGSIYATGKTMEVLTKENLKEVYEMDFKINYDEEMKQRYFMPVLKKSFNERNEEMGK